MDRLRQLLNQITTQLGVLSVSQRLALGLCAALIVVSLLWLMQWSTTPDLVPLVNYEFNYDELTAAESAIEAKGLPYKTRGRRLYVRSVDKQNLVRVLHEADALPEGSLFDMASVVADDNPFQSPEARKFAQNYAKGNELAAIIATSPSVTSARVMIQPVQKRRLGGRGSEPKASVNVALTPGTEMTTAMVEGLAKLVAGTVAGLKPYNVYVTDTRTMQSYSVPHPDDPGSVDFLGMVKQREAHYVAKIMNKLADVPGLRASVTVDLDTSKLVKQTQTYHKPEPKTESTETSVQSSGSSPSETGVQPNLGTAVTAGPSGGGNTSDKSDTDYYEPKPNETVTEEKLPFGTKRITATVGIPRSFVVSVLRAKSPDAAENPADDDPAFAGVRDAQVARVKRSVERIIQGGPNDVEVDVYPDMTWTTDGGTYAPGPGGIAAIGGEPGGFDAIGLARTYGPQAGLGLLAVMSLVMMMRIVRGSAEAMAGRGPKRDAAAAEEAEQLLAGGAQAVGRASASSGFLVGRELGEDALRAQELSSEVARMVEEDPEGAAELIRKWIEEPA